jgi:hypothetical protein
VHDVRSLRLPAAASGGSVVTVRDGSGSVFSIQC